MKSKFTLLILSIFMLAGSLSYASFPVERTTATTINTVTAVEETTTTLTSPAAVDLSNDQLVALLLAIFLGWVAAHRWYLGSPWYWNVLYIVTFQFAFVGLVIDVIDIVTGRYPGL